MYVTKPHKIKGFGAMDVTKPSLSNTFLISIMGPDQKMVTKRR